MPRHHAPTLDPARPDLTRPQRRVVAAVLVALVAVTGYALWTVPDDPDAAPTTYEVETRPAVAVTDTGRPLGPARTIAPTCSSACARWVEAVLLRQWLADNPPTGCASWACDRGGIRWRRPCAIPDYICDRESNPWSDSVPGLIDVRNSQTGQAKGKYQFMDGTFRHALEGQIAEWRAAGCRTCRLLADFAAPWVGRPASSAPEWVQDAAARWLYARAPGHWACC